MSLFSKTPIIQTIQQTHLDVLRSAFERTFFVAVDRAEDCEFIERVLGPIITRYENSPLYNVGKQTHLRTRNGEATAMCTRLTLVDDNSHTNESISETTLDRAMYGLIAFVERPDIEPSSVLQSRKYTEAEADVKGKKWKGFLNQLIAERRAMLCASPLAKLIAMDFATMQDIIVEAHTLATQLGVCVPRMIQARARIAFSILTPPLQEARDVMRANSTRHMMDSFVDKSLLSFYTKALSAESHCIRLAYGYAADEEIAAGGAPSRKIVRRSTDCSVNDSARSEPAAAIARSADLTPIDSVRDDASVFSMATSLSNQSTASSSAFSRASSASSVRQSGSRDKVKSKYEYSRDPYNLDVEPSILSDRLRGDQLAVLDVEPETRDDFFVNEEKHRLIDHLVQYLPPKNLMRRVSVAFSCVIRLIDVYCERLVDRFRSVDYYYLYSMAMLEREVIVAQRPATRPTVLCDQVRTACKYLFDLDDVLVAAPDVEFIERLVYSVVYESADIIDLSTKLFDDAHSFHTVIDKFQTRRSTPSKKTTTKVTMHAAVRVGKKELYRFISDHKLAWIAARIKTLCTDEQYSHSPVTHGILRFSANKTTPLALISSVIAFAPDARDGIDFLVVWTPLERVRALAGAYEDRNPPNEPFIYLTLSRALWRRLQLGAAPHALIQKRKYDSMMQNAPLMSPLLARALLDSDADNVIDALGAVEKMCASSTSMLKFFSQWIVGNNACRQDARMSATSLSYVASGIIGDTVDWTSRQNARALFLLKPLSDSTDNYIEPRGIYNAISACLSSSNMYCVIGLPEARELVADDDISVCDAPITHFISEQVAKIGNFDQGDRDMRKSRRPKSATEFSIEQAKRVMAIRCACGADQTTCSRVANQRDKVRSNRRSATKVLKCCQCKRTGLYHYKASLQGMDNMARKRPLPRTGPPAEERAEKLLGSLSICDSCSHRPVTPVIVPESDRVVLYDPEDLANAGLDRPDTHYVIKQLIEINALHALVSLNTGLTTRRLRTVPLPSKRSRRSRKDPQKWIDNIVEKTKDQVTEARQILKDPTHAERDVGADESELAAMLMQLEMMLLVDTEELVSEINSSPDSGPSQEVFDKLLPFSVEEMTALLQSTDRLIEPPVNSSVLFPLRPSEIVESVAPAGAEDTYSVGKVPTEHKMLKKSEDLLYAGRTERPLCNVPPGFTELVFANYYDIS